jgi:UDP-N-acetylmuramoyl-tripeptide--D-alanyl-D-alanine ligase
MTPKQAHDITRDNAGNAIGQATGNVKTATDAGPAGTSYQLSADLLATRTTGQWHDGTGPATGITSIEIDSRKCCAGSLFIALPGATADGHEFIGAAARNGAVAALVTKPDANIALPQLVVTDVAVALDALGTETRTAHAAAGGQLVGITGSVGKTGSKEMLAHLLCRTPDGTGCVASRASFNNHLGVPLTLSLLPDARSDTGVAPAVQEMGMNAAGEISQLSRMARPDVAVITCIADSHAGFFSSLADIAAAKAEIFDGMSPDGIAILNRDDEFFDNLAARASAAGITRIKTFGTHEQADYRLVSTTAVAAGQQITARLGDRDVEFILGMRSAHWAQNAMAVLATIDALGLDAAESAQNLHNFNDLPGRGAMSTGRFAKLGITLIDDSYNAGPRSMQAALASLHSAAPQILVLSDMLELGDASAAAHTALAPPILALRPRVVITIGDEMARMASNLPCLAASHHHADTPAAAISILHKLVCDGDTIFIKGSLGSGAWRVARAVLDAFSEAGPETAGDTTSAT